MPFHDRLSRKLLPSYQLEYVVGEGGFVRPRNASLRRGDSAHGHQATVYEASGPDGESVAVKRCQLSKSHFTVDRHAILRHESRILVHLRGHPSVPECMGYGTDDCMEYLVMPLLGPTLAERLNLDATTMLSLTRQMVRF
jgi:hypothetical protein